MTATRLSGVGPPPAGKAIRVEVDGSPVAVFNVNGTLFAIAAKCTHVGGPLETGSVSGTVVTCPLHGSRFDLRTGAVALGPATRPVRTYRVWVEGDALLFESA